MFIRYLDPQGFFLDPSKPEIYNIGAQEPSEQ